LNVTFLLLCRDSFLGPTCFLLFTWSSDTHVGLRDLDLGGFICRFVGSPTPVLVATPVSTPPATAAAYTTASVVVHPFLLLNLFQFRPFKR